MEPSTFYEILIVLVLIICIVLFRRLGWIPEYRFVVSENRFARWRLTYIFPLAAAGGAMLLVVLALTEWLGIISDPVVVRIVAIAIFVPVYLWQVFSWRKFIRKQDSGARSQGVDLPRS